MATLTYEIGQVVEMPPKHPDGVRIYTVNMAHTDGTTNDASTTDKGFLQSRTISSISVAASSPAGLTLDSSGNTTLAFTLTVSGGTDLQVYDFDVDVTLSTSEVEPVIVRILVTKQSSGA